MAHGYFDIDLNIVWQTVNSSLPALESQVAAAIVKIKGSAAKRSDEP